MLQSWQAEVTRLRAELDRSRAQLADAQQLARIGSWEWDLASNEVTWSDELFRIYGREPRSIEVSYEVFVAHVHPDDRESVDERNRLCFETHAPFEDVKRIVRPDGSMFLMRTRGEMVCDAGGTPLRMIGICEDVTDEVRARAASEQLASIVASSHDAIFSCTLDGVVTSFNPAAEALYGYDAKYVIGRSVEVLLDGGELPAWRREVAALAAGGSAVQLEMLRRRADGRSLEVSVALSPVVDHAGRVTRVADSARELHEVRRKRAMELNDTVLQSLVLATYRLDEQPEEARRLVERAIVQCRRIVDELLEPGQVAVAPGSLRREGPVTIG